MFSVFLQHRVFMSLAGRTVWVHSSFPRGRREDDWMSIFGHVGALVDGLCLITQCLVSAGYADGHNSSLSPQLTLIFSEHIHTDTAGQCTRVNMVSSSIDAVSFTVIVF